MDPFEQMRRIMEESLEEDRRREKEAAAPPRRRRTYIHRNREEAAARLERDYFSPNPVWGDIYFRRRFRMSRPLFLHIANTLAAREEFFREGFDAVGRPSHTTLQNVLRRSISLLLDKRRMRSTNTCTSENPLGDFVC